MLFNSTVFLAFFVVVYGLFLLTQRRLRFQNAILLIASYVFYGYWDARFLLLLMLSTVVDFTIARRMEASTDERHRKLLLITSIVVSLTILGFFKYFNFFADSFVQVLNSVGLSADPVTLRVLLPVGVSFYTFQTMSYTVDVYRRELKAASSLVDFALFVAFFPQLVAGPIERATNLLPQITAPRRLTLPQINAGVFLILLGYFKKLAIADNMALIANPIFDNYQAYQGTELLVGALAFTFQIYGDFSGYSDIARGLSKLMGFELMVNFNAPYLAVNPSDFWMRWHISLSSWLRDYLYIPLGGNRHGEMKTYRNLMLTMLLGGLWHGAAWNFVAWGGFHGIILSLYRRFERHPDHLDPWGTPARVPIVVMKLLLMFSLTVVGWILFRSRSVDQIVYFLSNMSPVITPRALELGYQLVFLIAPLLAIELWSYGARTLLVIPRQPLWVRCSAYSLMLLWLGIFAARQSAEFIYFQF